MASNKLFYSTFEIFFVQVNTILQCEKNSLGGESKGSGRLRAAAAAAGRGEILVTNRGPIMVYILTLQGTKLGI